MKKLIFLFCVWIVGIPMVLISTPLFAIYGAYYKDFKLYNKYVKEEWEKQYDKDTN